MHSRDSWPKLDRHDVVRLSAWNAPRSVRSLQSESDAYVTVCSRQKIGSATNVAHPRKGMLGKTTSAEH